MGILFDTVRNVTGLELLENMSRTKLEFNKVKGRKPILKNMFCLLHEDNFTGGMSNWGVLN